MALADLNLNLCFIFVGRETHPHERVSESDFLGGSVVFTEIGMVFTIYQKVSVDIEWRVCAPPRAYSRRVKIILFLGVLSNSGPGEKSICIRPEIELKTLSRTVRILSFPLPLISLMSFPVTLDHRTSHLSARRTKKKILTFTSFMSSALYPSREYFRCAAPSVKR